MEQLLHLPITIPIPTSITATATATATTTSSRLKFSFFHFRREANHPRRLNCKNDSSINIPRDVGISCRDDALALAADEPENGVESLEGNEFVEVFVIGSRRDAVIDYCISSPSLSPSLRFWHIIMENTTEVQLQQRYPVEAIARRNGEAPNWSQLGSKAIVLVVSAAYSYDHFAALDILSKVKTRNCLVVGIILKPFTFEGRRRQDEVKDLMLKLQKHAAFCIVVDTDALLEKDLVTLDEAFSNSNKAVLMALNAISVLTYGENMKLLNLTDGNDTIGFGLPELRKIVRSYGEGKIGYGSSYNVKNTILQAVSACLSLGTGSKDLDGVIVCILASSDVTNCGMQKIAHIFRSTVGFAGQLILSIVQDPHVQPKLIVSTVITFGCRGNVSSEKGGIFSSFARHFPFVLNIMKKQHEKILDAQESSSTELDALISGDSPETSFVNRTAETLFSNGSEEIFLDDVNSSEQSDAKFLEGGSRVFPYTQNSEGMPAFNRELLTRQNLGPGSQITEKWVKDKTDNPEVAAVHANVSFFRLPVGVKQPEKFKDSDTSNIKDQPGQIMSDNRKGKSLPNLNMSRKIAAADGLEFVTDLYKNSSSLEKKPSTNTSRRQRGLSTRAASMLEAERQTEKKLSRIVEMPYRGGFYRGQIQGGLPEGKGHLTLSDGSIYDGMWRYGKRSGAGTFYYSNGDFFQGSWRDDLMHGKGWLYFHTGDRWFVNFWKGKPNGEGRFYSKLGDVFFGLFKDGWRHGQFVHVSVDGTRCHEVWDEGVLVSRSQLDSDDASG